MSGHQPHRHPHLLVAEDNPILCAELARSLSDEGFVVSQANDVSEIFRAIKDLPIDLVTLDIGMGGDEGFGLALTIRAARNVPIVMITGRDTPADRLAGLEHGADDYITKPFLIGEVLLRVRRVLARYDVNHSGESLPAANFQGAKRLHFDGAVLDVMDRSITRHGAVVAHLTETEFHILTLLLAHPERVFSRDELSLTTLGRPWSPLDRSVDGHVARLRAKVGDGVDEPRLIRSVRGVGYVFIGNLTVEGPETSSPQPDAASPPAIGGPPNGAADQRVN